MDFENEQYNSILAKINSSKAEGSKIKAIYKGDIRHNEMPVFLLHDDGSFKMIGDESFEYNVESVISDEEFQIFAVNGEEYTQIK